MDGHAARCERVLSEFRQARGASGGGFGLHKKTSNLFRDRSPGRKHVLDMQDFNHVLAVDKTKGLIDAEGLTTYEELVARALEHCVMPAVVPQLKTITLGGAAAGVGIEASSFKYGLVHETISELEIMTGDGEIVVCTPENEQSDLFHAFPNSYGTLGYALSLRAAAVPVERFVELEHRRYTRAGRFFEDLERACHDNADFIDAVVFAPDELYLNVCRFVENAPHVSDYTFKHIYYQSIREKDRDFLTVHDFIWRWDTDWFWCSKNVGAEVPWIRNLYGRERLGSKTYQRIMRWNSRWGITRAVDRLRGGHVESVIQDVDIPIEHAEAFLDFFQREIGITPVWLCPIVPTAHASRFVLYPMTPRELYVNFGFWDVVRRPEAYASGHFNRLIERKVAELGGIKSLYSDCFYPEEEFWQQYGGTSYRALKSKYDPASVFPDLYAKCVLRA